MQNDENTVETQDETIESQPEVVEETTTEEEEAPASEPKPEGITLTGAELRHYNKWKASQNQPTKQVQPQTASPQLDVDERILLAGGMSEDLLNELKAIAQVRKVDLLTAQNDSIFVAVKEQFEKDKRRKEASLGASRGAPASKAPKKASTPGLTREEHMRLAKEAL
jgi:hypothetical protein